LAAEYIAAINQMKVGQFIDDPRQSYVNRPLSPSSKFAHIQALRCFFSDLMTWEWMTVRFDPRRTFQCPRSVAALCSPKPRIIAEDIWAKLLWAGLNLNQEDIPRSRGQNTTRHPGTASGAFAGMVVCGIEKRRNPALEIAKNLVKIV
jgi:hypothetical protein